MDMQDSRLKGEVKTTANGEKNDLVAQVTDWSETRGGKIHRFAETLPLVAYIVLGKKLFNSVEAANGKQELAATGHGSVYSF